MPLYKFLHNLLNVLVEIENRIGLQQRKPKSKSKLLYGRRSVSQYVLVSSSLVGLATRYCFLSECCLKFCGLVSLGRPLWLNGPSRSELCFTVSDCLRLPQPAGPGSRIYIPQEQGGPVILPGTGFPLGRLLRIASYDSQGYGGGIPTLSQHRRPGPGIYILQEQDGLVQSQMSKIKSKLHYDRRPVNQYVLVPSSLGIKGFHPNEFQSNISIGTSRRNCLCYQWEGFMWSMQCNVEFGYQLSICSGTKENHGKPWSSWPVAGPSWCKVTSSQ
jgi:hypothetical protein